MSEHNSNQAGVTRRQVLGWLGAAPTAAMLPWDPASAQASAGTLRVRIGSDVGNLDPAKIFAIENQTVAGHIYNGLVKYDQKTNKIVPDLASSWEISPDGTVFTFKLRDGVKFLADHLLPRLGGAQPRFGGAPRLGTRGGRGE